VKKAIVMREEMELAFVIVIKVGQVPCALIVPLDFPTAATALNAWLVTMETLAIFVQIATWELVMKELMEMDFVLAN